MAIAPNPQPATPTRVAPFYATGLRCRVCGEGYPLDPIHVCERCFGPLEVAYDDAALARDLTRESIAAGPPTLWRYKPLLPVATDSPIDLGAGWTPLLRAERLGRALGLDHLYIKNDCVNPTYSFKDRVVAVAVSRARELGIDTVACASTGNLAAAVAAAAAVAGLRCYVFVPEGLEASKIVNAGVYGPQVVQVKGNYDAVNRLCAELADTYNWGFVNVNLRPYSAEGSKTLGLEVCEQLGWRAPDHVVVPIASGALLVQIARGIRLLARTEGIFAETAGGVTVAVLQRLAEQGVLRRDETIVAYITGNGLKTPDAVAGTLPAPISVAPSVEAFEAVISGQ